MLVLNRHIFRSLLKDGLDALKFGLTEGSHGGSSRQEWAERGASLFSRGLYPMAAKIFLQAEDKVGSASILHR